MVATGSALDATCGSGLTIRERTTGARRRFGIKMACSGSAALGVSGLRWSDVQEDGLEHE